MGMLLQLIDKRARHKGYDQEHDNRDNIIEIINLQ